MVDEILVELRKKLGDAIDHSEKCKRHWVDNPYTTHEDKARFDRAFGVCGGLSEAIKIVQDYEAEER